MPPFAQTIPRPKPLAVARQEARFHQRQRSRRRPPPAIRRARSVSSRLPKSRLCVGSRQPLPRRQIHQSRDGNHPLQRRHGPWNASKPASSTCAAGSGLSCDRCRYSSQHRASLPSPLAAGSKTLSPSSPSSCHEPVMVVDDQTPWPSKPANTRSPAESDHIRICFRRAGHRQPRTYQSAPIESAVGRRDAPRCRRQHVDEDQIGAVARLVLAEGRRRLPPAKPPAAAAGVGCYPQRKRRPCSRRIES